MACMAVAGAAGGAASYGVGCQEHCSAAELGIQVAVGAVLGGATSGVAWRAASKTTTAAANTGANAVVDVGEVLKSLPKGRSSGVRTVGSDQELVELYGTLSRGGAHVEVPGYKGSWVELPNGTRVGIRDVSKSGKRTIDIKMPDGTTQKVHIDG